MDAVVGGQQGKLSEYLRTYGGILLLRTAYPFQEGRLTDSGDLGTPTPLYFISCQSLLNNAVYNPESFLDQ